MFTCSLIYYSGEDVKGEDYMVNGWARVAILSILILNLVACSNDNADTETKPGIENGKEMTVDNLPAKAAVEEEPAIPAREVTQEPAVVESIEDSYKFSPEFQEKLKRKYEMDLDHIKVINVDGELFETVMKYLHAVKEKDDKARRSTILHPDSFGDGFNSREPFIFAVTKLELDNSRAKAISDEFSLSKIASTISVVNMQYKSLDFNFNMSISEGVYIFVKTKDTEEWKLFATQ